MTSKYKIVGIKTEKALQDFFQSFNILQKTAIEEVSNKHSGSVISLAVSAVAIAAKTNTEVSLSIRLPELLEQNEVVPTELRPSWDEFFMLIAELAAVRSSCFARKVGAVIVKDSRHIIAVGYNGAYTGTSCMEIGSCKKESRRKELLENYQNASLFNTKFLDKAIFLIQQIKQNSNKICVSECAERPIIRSLPPDLNKSSHLTLYTTLFPCLDCAKEISGATDSSRRLHRVVYLKNYESSTGNPENNNKSMRIMLDAGIEIKALKHKEVALLAILYNLVHPDGVSRALKKPFEVDFGL